MFNQVGAGAAIDVLDLVASICRPKIHCPLQNSLKGQRFISDYCHSSRMHEKAVVLDRNGSREFQPPEVRFGLGRLILAESHDGIPGLP